MLTSQSDDDTRTDTSRTAATDTAPDAATGASTHSITWRPYSRVRRTALFRVVTDDGIAVLQHVREVEVRRDGPTRSNLDPDARIQDLPEHVLNEIRADGLTPATGRCSA